jgi:putative ABC transport system substrate-binding protein
MADKIFFGAKGMIILLFVLGPNIICARAEDVRITVLINRDAEPYNEVLAGFKRYLGEQGVDAKYKVFPLDGGAARTAQALREAKENGSDMLVTLGTFATESAINNGVKTPIVAGLVLRMDTLDKAANATGVVLEFTIETQFQWLRRFMPECRTIGVIYNPGENRERIEAASRAAGQMGLKLKAREVYAPRDLPDALRSLSESTDVLWGMADKIVLTPQTARSILLFSFRNRIPFVGLSGAWVKAGALYALGWDYSDLGRQCGEIAFKVLRGSRVESIPPVRPRKVIYSLNVKTARHMKMKIPGELVRSAGTVF